MVEAVRTFETSAYFHETTQGCTGGAGIVVLGGSESSSILVQKSGLFW
jgi:hypothetical protein